MLPGATTEDRRTTVPTKVTRRLVRRCVIVYVVLARVANPLWSVRWGLAAQAEALDQGSVARDIDLSEVVQQVAATADHEEQATPGVMVVLVLFEVLGKVPDPLAQQGDLRFRGPSVSTPKPIFGQDASLLFGGQRHG